MKSKAVEPFNFDGHGVNDAEGKRLAKLSIPLYLPDRGTLMPERNPEFDNLGELFARAPEMRDCLKVCKQWLPMLERIGSYAGELDKEDSAILNALVRRIESLTSQGGAYAFVHDRA